LAFNEDETKASFEEKDLELRTSVIAGVKWDTTAGAKIPNIADKKNPHL